MKQNTELQSDNKQAKSLVVKTNVKAGELYATRPNHNEKQAKNLIVKTGVKAGGISKPTGPYSQEGNQNHNEKFDVDNNDSIKSAKSIIRKLSLKKESIRELKESELKGIAGGYAPTNMGCSTRPC